MTIDPGNLRRFKQAGMSVAILAVFPVCHAITPLLLRDMLPVCPFRVVTGKPCPLCGLTRAIALATHGRVREAFKLNPSWPLFSAAMLGASVLLAADALKGARLTERSLNALSKNWIWILAALAVFGVWRIFLDTNWNS